MKATRVVLMLLGFAVAGYGVALLLENPRVIVFRIVVWALAGVALHDLVFAPLCVALGFAGRRLIPRRWWAPVALGAFCTVVLILLAIPVYDKPGMHLDNRTVLDRNYHAGLWISLGLVWACTALYLVGTWLGARRSRRLAAGRDAQPTGEALGVGLPVGEDQVVDQQGADNVGPQPPAVG